MFKQHFIKDATHAFPWGMKGIIYAANQHSLEAFGDIIRNAKMPDVAPLYFVVQVSSDTVRYCFAYFLTEKYIFLDSKNFTYKGNFYIYAFIFVKCLKKFIFFVLGGWISKLLYELETNNCISYKKYQSYFNTLLRGKLIFLNWFSPVHFVTQNQLRTLNRGFYLWE